MDSSFRWKDGNDGGGRGNYGFHSLYRLMPALLAAIFALALLTSCTATVGSVVPAAAEAARAERSVQKFRPADPNPAQPLKTHVQPAGLTSPEPARVASVFGDSLGKGWGDASWDGTASFDHAGSVHDGTAAIVWTPSESKGDWAAFSLGREYGAGEFDVSGYTNFRFYIRGSSADATPKRFSVSLKGSAGPKVDITPHLREGSIPPGEWRLVDIPLTALGVDGGTVGRIIIQDNTGKVQPPTYFDDVEFYGSGRAATLAQSAVDVVVTVDASSDERAISPLIYGVGNSSGAESYYGDMGATLVRWGGNARTRHNWEINASNAGSDWEFRNLNQANGSTTPGQASLDFVTKNRAIGAESLLTIPTIGWVARNGDNKTRSTGAPSAGGAPVRPGSEAIAGYDPSANRNATSVRSEARKGGSLAYPPDTSDGVVYQDEWVSYLKKALGGARDGGVRLYAMDNESDLWADDTHVDIHPVRVGYDESLERFLDYAEAVKAIDPTAEVTGPVAWGWLGLWYSALDRGGDSFATHADRRAHDDVPFGQWFLQKAKEHEDASGQRVLDVLDVHFYPQGGIYSKATDSATQARRLRSTRSLWDAGYEDESWISRSEGGPAVRLIPRLKEWIARYYPGTKLGITEWNWGADGHISGALAIADVLGIFGREGVDVANYWTSPAEGSPGYWAWRMYRNYDGSRSAFGDVSVRGQTSDLDKVSVYASKDSSTGQLKVMLVNKMPATDAGVALEIGSFATHGAAQVYEFSPKDLSAILRAPDVNVESGRLYTRLAPYSITLIVFES